jgi:hypothetical protein
MIKKCKCCNKEFNADPKEVSRGNAIFCSLSCAATHNNKNRPLKTCKCSMCDANFESMSTTAKYCSKKCKSKYYRQLISTAENGTRKLQKILLTLPCANCGWEEGPRDVHHITPASKGGTNEMNNLITLCPNCHRLSHRNLLSEDKLRKLVYLRTISSS